MAVCRRAVTRRLAFVWGCASCAEEGLLPAWMFVPVEETPKEVWEVHWGPREIKEDREISIHQTTVLRGGGRGGEPEMFISCACLPIPGIDVTDDLAQGGGRPLVELTT
ncbi:hypothetical protein G5714_021481 [Onychostoma macrolepis]|uniref:Uncharacterized protein n=1 Tax=Onychostoma macrolepis TaxID=369639 RepID=A0A7J6BSJ6_9TELE|nr:hypothetical protein G5714_021481 [Onychostoma macrolepis]